MELLEEGVFKYKLDSLHRSSSYECRTPTSEGCVSRVLPQADKRMKELMLETVQYVAEVGRLSTQVHFLQAALDRMSGSAELDKLTIAYQAKRREWKEPRL